MLPTTKTPPRTSLADLTVLVYGPTKIGKTTWCSHAEGALFLATEAGLNNLETFQVAISTWEQLLAACGEIAAGNHAFKTIVLDTVDNAYRMCADYVCAKHKVEHESDLAYGKGYALITNEFYRVLNKLALLPYGLFLISHAQEREFETRTGKVMRVVPTLPDKARKVVLGMADMVLFCDLDSAPGADGKQVIRRVMRTKPSAAYEAGDRTGRLPETIDLDYRKFIEAFSGASTACVSTVRSAPQTAPADSAATPPATRKRTTAPSSTSTWWRCTSSGTIFSLRRFDTACGR
ncbi:MAG: ATP-binding protein, partial [Planctomycetes bacterium]|nr:ATP-binding protein [Planctomycetota bacterium]